MELNPYSIEANSYKVIPFRLLGRLEEALQCYEKILHQKSGDYKIWYTVGIVHGKMGDYEEALQDFEQALKMKHDFNEAIVGKSLMLIKLGKIDKANLFVKRT